LFNSRVSEGKIEYKIVVLDSNNPMARFAPDKMTIKFKNNLSFAQVIAGMGLFETDFVNDEPRQRIIQMVRLLNKKMYYIEDTAAANKDIKQTPAVTVTPTNDTKIIAGYKCKRVKISYKDDKLPSCDFYYTDDIELDNTNWATPYKEIKGVLMAYRIVKYGFYMEFTATRVEPDKIDDKTFNIPSEYKRATKEQMDQIYKSFQ
jgi:hypothetical protein